MARTAGCGPACPVVWEGSNWVSVGPYPDPNGLAHISKARARAQSQNATLNDEFRRWLAHFANAAPQPEFRALMASMSDVRPGKAYLRDEATNASALFRHQRFGLQF
jgi:hypothetical protein